MQGAKVRAHDPKADEKELAEFSGFDFFRNIDEALFETEAIAIMTGWEEYKNIDWKILRKKFQEG